MGWYDFFNFSLFALKRFLVKISSMSMVIKGVLIFSILFSSVYSFGERKRVPTKPLHKAVNEGNLKKVRELIKKGADVNEINNGSTPMGWIRNKTKAKKEIAEILIDSGVDANAVLKGEYVDEYYGKCEKNSVYHINPNGDIYDLTKGPTPLDMFMRKKFPMEVMELLVKRGADLKELNKQSGEKALTGLHRAVLENHLEAVKLLVKYGADINARDYRGNTPLYYTLNKSLYPPHFIRRYSVKWEFFKFLIKHGADVNAKNNAGESFLHYYQGDNSDIFKLLIKHGADVNIRNNGGSTPLHYYRLPRNVKLLIKYGADVNAKNNAGKTPLHNKVIYGDRRAYENIKTLLKNGADVNARDNKGETPLDHALKPMYHVESKVIELLKSHGATATGSSEK